MTVSIDDFGASLIQYRKNIVEVLNKETRVRQICKGKVENWQGEKLVDHVHTEWTQAINFIEDGGALPASRKQGYVESSCYRKHIAGSVGITAGMLANANSTEGAAITVLKSELQGLVTSMKNFSNFFWTRDGTGIVTYLGATVSDTVTPYVITADDIRMMWPGADFVILDATTPTTEHVTFRVKSTARSYNNTLNSGSITCVDSVPANGQAADDLIVWGTSGRTSYGRAITGLQALIDDAASTFQGVDCATHTRWTSPVFDNSGTRRALTPELLRQVLATLVQESGQRELVLLGNVWQFANFDEMFESAVHITPDTNTVGQSTPSFQSSLGKVTLESDQHSPYGELMFIDPQAITYAVLQEAEWMPVVNGAAGILGLDPGGTAKYRGHMLEMSELFIAERNHCARLIDLEENVGTAY